MAGKTGGPIGGVGRINAQGAGPSFGTHLVDLEVDPETRRTTILRYTVAQDAGRALHPAYVEGQYQGGAVQGIGWALNEGYIYGSDGKLQNAGFPVPPSRSTWHGPSPSRSTALAGWGATAPCTR